MDDLVDHDLEKINESIDEEIPLIPSKCRYVLQMRDEATHECAFSVVSRALRSSKHELDWPLLR